jgi:hypothetical protein
MIEIDMAGMEELIAKFKKLGERGDAAMMRAMTEVAVEGVTEMKSNVPVITNRLRSSIHFETPKTATFDYKDKNGQLFIGTFVKKPVGLSVGVGTNVEYAGDVNAFSPTGRGFFMKGVNKMQEILPIRMTKNLDKLLNE